MAKCLKQIEIASRHELTPLQMVCPKCAGPFWIAERTVTHLLQRYEELVALHVADRQRVRERFKEQGQVILALDGLQPDVGHEVLWVVRDCLSGEILLARSLLSACEADLASLLR